MGIFTSPAATVGLVAEAGKSTPLTGAFPAMFPLDEANHTPSLLYDDSAAAAGEGAIRIA